MNFPAWRQSGLDRRHGMDLVTLGAALSIAKNEARSSNCVRRQVGAILLDPQGVQISLGHNRVGKDTTKCSSLCPRAMKTYEQVKAFSDYTAPGAECYSIHAEAMAMQGLDHLDAEGCVMVVTCQPCPGCQYLLDQAGVLAVWVD